MTKHFNNNDETQKNTLNMARPLSINKPNEDHQNMITKNSKLTQL